MRLLRFAFAWLFAFFYRFRVVLLIGILSGAAIFFIVGVVAQKVSSSNVLYIGVVGRYKIDELPTEILSQVSGGLTSIDSEGKPVPDLAKSWETQEKGKVWVFKIDTTKRWHDGTNIDSSSIQYNFDGVEIERPDSETIVFKLQSPYSPFASVVSRPIFKKGLVGTGEWRATNISIQSNYVEKLVLVNDDFGVQNINFYPSEESAKTDFKLGHIDQINSLYDPSPTNSWSTTDAISQVDDTRYAAVFFNNRGLFKDNKTLRQALAYAIDKSLWVDKRALSPVPAKSWAYNSSVKPYDFDIERAKKLLEEVKSIEEITINLTTNPLLLSEAEKIAESWQEVGIKTNVSVANELSEDYDAFLTFYGVSLDPDQYLTWHSTQTQTNITHYSNPRIDKLLEDGRLEMDLEKRKKIYLDFQRFLLEDAPAVFLYHPVVYTITRK